MYILRQEKLRNNNVAATQNDIFNFAEVIKKVRARACGCVRKGVCVCVCERERERERERGVLFLPNLLKFWSKVL